MSDRLEEIRAHREAATPGGELFARLTQECEACYTPQAQLLRACTYHEGWLDGHGERDPDIDYLLAELERLTEATEQKVTDSVSYCYVAQGNPMTDTAHKGNDRSIHDEIRARAEAATPGPWEVGVTYNHDRNATFIAHAREDIPYLLAEVERLRAALQNISDQDCDYLGCTTCPSHIAHRALTEGGES